MYIIIHNNIQFTFCVVSHKSYTRKSHAYYHYYYYWQSIITYIFVYNTVIMVQVYQVRIYNIYSGFDDDKTTKYYRYLPFTM